MSILWFSFMPPPYDGTVGRVVLTRLAEGEEIGGAAARSALLAFPDVLIVSLSINVSVLADDIIMPDQMLDRALDGLDVAAAQRILAEQVQQQQPN